MSLTLNPSNLVAALNLVEKVTGRTCAESLNRAALHTIIGSKGYPGAMQLTPKADRAKIQAIPLRVLRAAVVVRAKRTGRWPLTRAQINDLVSRERSRRLAAIGYLAYAGWNNAAKGVGGKGLKTNSGFSKSDARFGQGIKAGIGNLLAIITNTAPASERLGFNALQLGLDNAAQDLTDYAHKKMQSNFDKVKP